MSCGYFTGPAAPAPQHRPRSTGPAAEGVRPSASGHQRPASEPASPPLSRRSSATWTASTASADFSLASVAWLQGYVSYTEGLLACVFSTITVIGYDLAGLTASSTHPRSGCWPAQSHPATAAKDEYAPHVVGNITCW